MKRYTGWQPQYFPRLHYFARILNTDVFVIRDDVQFVRDHKYPNGVRGKSYQAHCPVKTSQGLQLLNVPVRHGKGLTNIFETEIEFSHKWKEKHLNILRNAYRKSVNYERVFSEIEQLLAMKLVTLCDLNVKTICWGIYRLLGEPVRDLEMVSVKRLNKLLSKQHLFRLKKVIKGTQTQVFGLKKDLSANETIVQICRELGANEDYCGKTAVDAYVDKEMFKKEGIKLTIQDWSCREYEQVFADKQGFIPNLSIIDLLMNVDHKTAIEIIKG